jgi:hypothetical protein
LHIGPSLHQLLLMETVMMTGMESMVAMETGRNFIIRKNVLKLFVKYRHKTKFSIVLETEGINKLFLQIQISIFFFYGLIALSCGFYSVDFFR